MGEPEGRARRQAEDDEEAGPGPVLAPPAGLVGRPQEAPFRARAAQVLRPAASRV